jgi:hypothetical protein
MLIHNQINMYIIAHNSQCSSSEIAETTNKTQQTRHNKTLMCFQNKAIPRLDEPQVVPLIHQHRAQKTLRHLACH